MTPAKKVEIIVEAVSQPKIIALLAKLNIQGYSIIKEVSGSGSHGTYDAEEISDLFKNVYFMVICSDQEAHTLLEATRSLIKKYGGIAFTSEVQLLKK
jgi:nitrogen regulatory protein PII